jgi:hypothetical protein
MVFSVAFDLDSTLGYFESVHPYLMVFFPDMMQQVFKPPHYKGDPFPKLNVSDHDKKTLEKAFDDFVNIMAKREHLNKLLRPGILDIIRVLLKAKKRGLIDGMMIYSSNSNPYMLQFAQRLIQVALGTKAPVFDPLVHWWHPLRNAEVRAPGTELELGHGPKTVDTIIKALSSGRVKIKEQDILFFDDLVHPDIRTRIPDANYFHVERYVHYGVPLNIYSCFLYALMKYNLDKNVSLMNEYKKMGLLIGKTDEDIQSFKKQTPLGVNVNVHDTNKILHRLSDLLDRPVAHVTTVRKGLPKSVTIVARGGKKATRKSERTRLKIYRLLTCLD